MIDKDNVTRRISSENGHWYKAIGKGLAEPCYEVPLKKSVLDPDGSTRTTTSPTVRHARSMGLLRSVTGTIKMLANDGLVNWLLNKAIKFGYDRAMMDADLSIDAALMIGQQGGLSGAGIDSVRERWANSLTGRGDHLARIEQALASGVMTAWERERSEAPDRGKVMHSAIEESIVRGTIPTDDEASKNACQLLSQMGRFTLSETSLGQVEAGYGCRLDAVMIPNGSESWKTVDFKTVQKARPPLESELWQLAANDNLVRIAATLGGVELDIQKWSPPALIYISQESGAILNIHNMQHDDVAENLTEFMAILDLWCILNRHDIRKHGAA